MENIIVYIDDAAHAQHQLAPMKSGSTAQQDQATHWVLVACPPRLTRRIGKWVSHSAREAWRTKWSEKVFDQVVPQLRGNADRVTMVVATGPLVPLTRKLVAEHGVARVLDARRPKLGQDLQPVTADQPTPQQGRWTVPGAVAGMGAVLVLAAE